MDELLILVCVICMCCLSSIIGGIMYAVRSKKSGPVAGLSGGGGDAGAIGTLLTIPSPSSKKVAPWYISSWSNPKAASSSSEGLKASYKVGSVGSAGGTGFKANPSKSLPAESATVSYSVYFPNNFDFRKGGKAGCGLCLGTKVGECDTGGEHSKSGGSVRVVWKENGQGIAYIYLPTQVQLSSQGAAFKKVADSTDKMGIHIFGKSAMKFKKGEWNAVSLSVKLNNPSASDGLLRITINGVTEEITDMVYRRESSVKINTMSFTTFFGGSTKDYAPLKPETATFKDFRFIAA